MSRFARVPEALIEDHRVSSHAVRVYARMERYQGQKRSCYASREALAADLGLSVATVRRAVQELLDAGWISRRRRAGNTWETTVHEQPVEAHEQPVDANRGESPVSRRADTEPTDRRLTGEPTGESPVSRPGESPVSRRPKAAAHGCTPGGSRVSPRRVTGEPPKEREELDERNSMRGLVAADAPTPPKTLALVEAKPDPEVLIDIEPTGPTPEQITRALVGAYAEAWRDSAGVYPPDRKCAAIGRNVKPLIAEGWAPPVLLLAVQRAGAARNLDVDGQLGTARAAYDRSGSSRQALFAAWDTRITKGIGS